MTTGVTCTVYVDGQRVADGAPGDDLTNPVVLDDLAVTWGRDDTMSQPEPDTCTFEVMDHPGGRAFGEVFRTGLRVDVVARGTTFPDPSEQTFTNPGFELPAVTWAASSATATRSTRRPRAGAYSLAVKPAAAGTPGGVLLAPGELQPPGTNPDAWDAIPVTSIGQRWAWSLAVWLPVGATASVGAVRFAGPYLDAAQALGEVEIVRGNGAWQTVGGERVVQVHDQWVGLSVTLNPTGPAWDELPPDLTWDAVAPDLAWDDFGQAFLDDVSVTSPVGSGGRGVLVFSGRITDLAASWDTTTNSPVVSVAAAGFTADLDNRTVGDVPWNVETVDARAHRILDAAGMPVDIDIDTSVDTILVSWRDVDAQGATGLLRELATSVDGVLWPAVHQSLGTYLRLEDPSLRASLLRLDELDGPPPEILARNLDTNPRAAVSTNWLMSNGTGGASSAASVSGVTDGPNVNGQRVNTYRRFTVTTAATGGGFGPYKYADRTGVAGDTATIGMWFRASVPWQITTVFARFLNGSTAAGAAVVTLPGLVPANTWTWISGDATATGAYTRTQIWVQGTPLAAGSTVDVTASLSSDRHVAGGYFDGTTPDTSTRNYAWTGAANSSASTVSTVQTHTIVIVETDPASGFDLSACQVLRDPVTWVQTVSDVVTRVAVSWKVQGVDDEGNPTTSDATVTEIDAELETTYGTRAVSVSTQLQAEDDATTVAAQILSRTSPDDWRAQGVTVEDDDVPGDVEGVGLMLDLLDGTSRIGAPVVLGDLPDWSPSGATAGVYLEGGTYRFVGGRWVLELLVSSAGGRGQSAQWDQLDPAWTWNQWDPGVSWNDLRGVAAP